MTKTFTPDDLIRYIYGETDKQETEKIESDILCNNSSMEEFSQLIEIKQSLDKMRITPSETVISNILDYSKSFEMPQFTD